MPEKIAEVRSVTEVAPGVRLYDLAMVEPAELAFRAGQYVSVRMSAEGDVRRAYSIASSPARKDGFQLLVKLLDGGVGSEYFRALAVGGRVHFTGPMGFFVCDLAHAGDAVFAVTGSGIAAALPMIEDTLGRPAESGRVLLYWGLRRAEDVYFRDRLDALAARSRRFRHHICLTRPPPDWAGVDGRITRHVLDALPGLDRPVFYLVGNGEMVRDLTAALVERAVDRKRQVRSEVFYPVVEA